MTLSMMVHWKVKDHASFLGGCSNFIELTKMEPGVKYYGFTAKEELEEAVCKEGYESAECFMAHLKNVDSPLQAALRGVDITKIEAHGPQAELDKLRGPLADFPVTYWAYTGGAFFVPAKYAVAASTASDTTLSMMVYWKVKDPAAFLKGCRDFVELTKEERGVRYYGFTLCGDEAVCKEGYDSADGFLAHLKNVDRPLKAALKVADIVKIEAHGPQAELDKLRSPLADFPVTYWAYTDGAFFVPAQYS